MKVKSQSEVAQSCPTLSDLMGCSLPGSSVHGIFQAGVLEWGAIDIHKRYTNTLNCYLWGVVLRNRDIGSITFQSILFFYSFGNVYYVQLKFFLTKVKEESQKVGLKLNIEKTKIMVSGPISSWQIDGETVETLADYIFLGSKITADGDCSHEIKRHLFLERKVMTNLDSIFKSRDIALPKRPV